MSFSEWEEVTLKEISIGEKGNYGIAAAAVDYSEDLYTYLRITDINDDGALIKENLKSVDDENSSKYLLKPNDIVFARTGNSTGRSYFYDGSYGELVFAGFLIKFSLNSSRINPKFMRYYTLSEDYKNWVASFKTGSTRGNINAKTYGDMKINLPPRAQQNFLVDVLSTLDEKIEVNSRINKTMGKMAQAIFKHWFVDFEFPNEEGEPYKSSGGEMVESELGPIPKGWEVKSLYSIADYINGTSFKKDEVVENLGIPIIKIAELKSGYNSNTKYYNALTDKKTKYYLKKKDILFSWSGNPDTSIDIFIWTKDDGILNQHIFKVEPVDVPYSYMYLLLKSFKPIFTEIASNKQTTGLGHVTVRDLKRLKICIPTEDIIEAFISISDSIIDKMFSNSIENIVLEKTRDTLLPKLMSGEIRVPLDIEEQ